MAKKMKITKGVVSREEALRLAPDYVKYSDHGKNWWELLTKKVIPRFEKMKRGQEALTYIEGQFVRVKVTSLNSNTYQAIDGPVVRVSNGEYSWRVDGSGYAYPL